MPRRFLFLQASARPEGNALAMARRAASFLPAEVVQDWRDLTDPALEPFADLRHGQNGDSGPGYAAPLGVAKALAQATLAASDLVMVAPLYWYGLPAPAKLYLDHWSHWMRVADLGFKAAMADKRMWLVMSHAGSLPAELAPAVEGLRLASAYLGMGWGGALLVDANAPGQWQQDKAAMARAAGFFTA